MNCSNCGEKLILTYNDSFEVWRFIWSHKDPFSVSRKVSCFEVETEDGVITVMDTHELGTLAE